MESVLYILKQWGVKQIKVLSLVATRFGEFLPLPTRCTVCRVFVYVCASLCILRSVLCAGCVHACLFM